MKPIVALLLCSVLLLAAATAPSNANVFPFGDLDQWWPHRDDVKMPTEILCMERGCCYKMKLQCPYQCFKKAANAVTAAITCSLDCNKCEATC